jgi:hypothetical protein
MGVFVISLVLSLGSEVASCVPGTTCTGRELGFSTSSVTWQPRWTTPTGLFFFKPCKKLFECKPAPAGPPYTSLQKCFLSPLNVLFWVGAFPTLSLFCVVVKLPSDSEKSNLKCVPNFLSKNGDIFPLWISLFQSSFERYFVVLMQKCLFLSSESLFYKLSSRITMFCIAETTRVV